MFIVGKSFFSEMLSKLNIKTIATLFYIRGGRVPPTPPPIVENPASLRILPIQECASLIVLQAPVMVILSPELYTYLGQGLHIVRS